MGGRRRVDAGRGRLRGGAKVVCEEPARPRRERREEGVYFFLLF